jgi:steroid 5-alpha reductase family enzyme
VHLPALLVASAIAILGLMAVGWLLSLALRDASVVDTLWGLGFALVAGVALAVGPGLFARRLLVLALVGAWGLRLSSHILRRNWGKGEDFRYREFREWWGKRFWWVSLFTVFLLQGVLMFVVSLPIQVAGAGEVPVRLGVLEAVGALVWAVGLAFEAIGDLQLSRFTADPASKGKVMDRGLWRYTRHPNYFGDSLVWWGIGLVALTAPWGWAALAGPALMTFLLVRVSGVAMLEKTIAQRRPGYEGYVHRTSAFVPLPPRKA